MDFKKKKIEKKKFRPLDYLITENEILKAAKKLKNNKSSYSDKIRNEMIKASINVLMSVYYKLFNAVLNACSMPQTWCVSLITPICKSGGRSDPSNYRRICVSSCLGKLFCSILNQRLLEYMSPPIIYYTSHRSASCLTIVQQTMFSHFVLYHRSP